MSTLTDNAKKELIRIGREKAELTCQLAGVKRVFLDTDPAQFDQEDIAMALVLTAMRDDDFAILAAADSGKTSLLLETLKLPILGKGNEIFACGFTPSDSIFSRAVEWAVLFNSEGPPKLRMEKGNISMVFPECEYKVKLHSDKSDFHLCRGTPMIELYTNPSSRDRPHNRRKVAVPEGPFPVWPLLPEILTGNPLKYNNLVCNTNRDHHFIAAPTIGNGEGLSIVYRIRQVFQPELVG